MRQILSGIIALWLLASPAQARQASQGAPEKGALSGQDSLSFASASDLSLVGLRIKDGSFVNLRPRRPELYQTITVDPADRILSDYSCSDCVYPRSGLNTGRMVVVTGIVAAAQYSVFQYEQNQWYDKYSKVSFRFDDHLDYAYNFDKVGHIFGTYAWALGVARLYESAGVKPKTAALVGAIFGWAAQFQVEVYDGFIPRFGFDRFDIAANTIGAGWFYAQQRIQTLRNWHLRMGYYPEKIRQEDGSFYKLPGDQILADDYSNQSYWLAVRLHNYLPKEKKKYWPSFLMISGGVALDNWIAGSEFNDGQLTYYLSIDLDWAKILPQKYLFGRAFADALNMFRLPFPAIRIHPGVKFVPMYLGN